ncbi:hypothetical protein [Nonomuraea jabiensis]|uniref:Uncharacterized protein n=1 Tax=Nonomuraea jabiensis TaxID=882448 RepID=A0A7W9LGR7_9ACTN|nr:hypothetical protein [Nonomuraea jabiensis]MBB5783224.1 hypothetical protein [Nonomuraea jabiensis]
MIDADQRLGRRRRTDRLILAVTLKPCLIWYGLESPSDGAADAAAQWQPQRPGAFGSVLRAVIS